MLSQKSFKSYIRRVLRNVHPSTNITKKAINCVDGFLRTVATTVSHSAQLLTAGSERRTLSSNEVRNALRVLLPDKLSKSCDEYGMSALETYNTHSKPEDSKPITREARAGLMFSVSLTEKYLRNFGQSSYNVGGAAPVFLAAALEFLTSGLCVQAGNICQMGGKHNITTRHVFLAMSEDTELSSLSYRLNLVILESGVQPFIHDSLVNRDRRQSRRKGLSDGEKKKHRWHPGTVALRKIRSYQKNVDLLVQRAPFERVVREVTAHHNDNSDTKVRFTNEFKVDFQNFIEECVVRLLRDANSVAVHNERETVYPGDIDLVVQLQRLPIENVTLESSVPAASLRKLAYRAGVKRISQETIPRVEQFLFSTVSHYMRGILICAEHSKRQTVNTKLLLESLALNGVCLATVPEKRRRRRAGGESSTQPTVPATKSRPKPAGRSVTKVVVEDDELESEEELSDEDFEDEGEVEDEESLEEFSDES